MQLSDSIKTVISSAVEAAGLALYGAEWVTGEARSVLRIYIEKKDAAQGGVVLDDCEHVSRQLSALMDVEGLLPQSYVLEVSSPGLDRPLFIPAHYEASLGKKVMVKLSMPKEGRRNIKGTILECQNGKLSLQSESGIHQLALTEIQSARIEPDFFQSHARGG